MSFGVMGELVSLSQREFGGNGDIYLSPRAPVQPIRNQCCRADAVPDPDAVVGHRLVAEEADNGGTRHCPEVVHRGVRMLWALRDGELDVSSLAAVSDCRPTVASQHLSKLRFAGLVEGQRQGQRVVYRLRGAHVRALLVEALFHADHQVSGAPVHD